MNDAWMTDPAFISAVIKTFFIFGCGGIGVLFPEWLSIFSKRTFPVLHNIVSALSFQFLALYYVYFFSP